MGKFVNFALNQNVNVADNAQATAAKAAADAILAQSRDESVVATPTEQIQQAVPTGSPEGLQRVQEAAPVAAPVSPEAQPEQLTDDQVASLYQQQLQSEQPTIQPYNAEDGSITLPLKGKLKGEEVGTVTEGVAKMSEAIQGIRGTGTVPGMDALTKLGLAQEVTAGGYTKQQPLAQAGGAAYLAAMIALQKSAGQVDVVPEPVADLEGAEAEVALESKTATQQQLDDATAVGRFALTKSVAEEFEKLVRPAPNVDPVTGESSGFGYESSLSDTEKVGLGDIVLQSMTDAGLAGTIGEPQDGVQLIQRRRVGKQFQYLLTPRGKEFLDNMSSVLEEVAPALKRPVSLTPLVEGRYSGAAATRQKGLTKTPLEGTSALTPTMTEAMDVMSQMPNIISDHKFNMTQSMLLSIDQSNKAIQEANAQWRQQTGYDQKVQQITGGLDWAQLSPDQKQAMGPLNEERRVAYAENARRLESPFAKLFDLDQQTNEDLVAESEFGSRFTVEVKKVDGVWVKNKGAKKGEPASEADQEYFNQENPDAKNGQTAKRSFTSGTRQDKTSHRKFANDVQKMSLRKAQKTMKEATDRKGQAFYYGVTAIGNSSRLMVTQTELNYQSNKLARFLVDNPRPAQFKKGEGGKTEAAFKYVIARAVMADADLYTPDRLKREFDNQRKTIDGVARAWYQASQTNDPQQLAAAFKQLEALAEQKIIPDEFEGTGEWGFILDGLHEWGKYLNAADGAQVSTRVKAEVDGINNGSSIQGLQFGSDTILRRAGVIYKEGSVGEKEGLVIPWGNMRDLVFNTLFNTDEAGGMIGSMGLKTETERAMAEGLLDKIKSEGLKKKFIKIPLMTTIYGKPSGMHGDHVRDFLAQNSGKLGLQPDDYKMAAKVLTKAIDNGLSWSLNDALQHQDLIKYSAGWFFNMMDEIPQVVGPNGFVVQSGGVDYVPDTETEGLPTGKGGSAGKAVQQLKYGPKDKPTTSQIELNIQRPSAAAAKAGHGAVGSITRNQLAVSGTHNIDATIAQLTMIRAKRKQGNNFWGQQVFDAFIGDVTSLEDLLDIGNRTFAQVNNTYSMIDAEKDAYDKAKQDFAKKVSEAGDTTWSVFDGPHRSIGAFFKRFIDNETRWENQGAMISKLRSYGFDFDEKGKLVEDKDLALSPKQVKDLIDTAEKNFLAEPRANSPLTGKTMDKAFGALKAHVDKRRSDFRKKYLKERRFIRQFN